MNTFHCVRAKEGIPCEGLVVFLPEAVNVLILHGHGPDEGPFRSQGVPSQPQGVPCSVAGLLSGGDHVEPLFQKLSSLFTGEAVLSLC